MVQINVPKKWTQQSTQQARPHRPRPGGFSKTKKSHLAGINFTQKDGWKANISCHEQSSARVIAAKKK